MMDELMDKIEHITVESEMEAKIQNSLKNIVTQLNGLSLSINQQQQSADGSGGGVNESAQNVTEEITIDEFNNSPLDHVFIRLPTLLLNSDSKKPDNHINNYRAIKLTKFVEILNYMETNEKLTRWDHIMFIRNMIPIISDSNSNKLLESLLEGVSNLAELIDDVELDPIYVDINSTKLSFDPIRKYVNDEKYQTLLSCEPSNYNGCVFYSQLTPNAKKLCRIQNNDTDLNRMYYKLNKFIESLLMIDGRTYDSSNKYITLLLIFIHLVNNSIPIAGLCLNDLIDHYIAVAVDTMIRTRVVECWHNRPHTKILIRDMVLNHKNNFYVDLCKYSTSKERYEYINKCLQMAGHQGLSSINYSTYLDMLSQTAINDGDNTYYKLNTEFITKLDIPSIIKSMKGIDTVINKNKRKLSNLGSLDEKHIMTGLPEMKIQKLNN